MAKQLGHRGLSKLKKMELIALLEKRARVYDISGDDDATFSPEISVARLGLKPRRGDLLQTLPPGYRDDNSGILIWNGQLPQQLSYEDDVEYGQIPRSYQVSDTAFAPDYWKDAIKHNSYFYPAKQIRQRAATNPKSFNIGGKRYSIGFEQADSYSKRMLVKNIRNRDVPFIYKRPGKLAI